MRIHSLCLANDKNKITFSEKLLSQYLPEKKCIKLNVIKVIFAI